jgi:transposase
VRKKLEEGWKIYSCYEAGASGYWLHRELVKLGVKNLVVVPKAMGRGGQKQKTDKRDDGELCDSLDRYLQHTQAKPKSEKAATKTRATRRKKAA